MSYLKTILYLDKVTKDSCLIEVRPRLTVVPAVDYKMFTVLLKLEFVVLAHDDTDCLFAPQKQKLPKGRRESETQRMRTTMTMMKTTIKSKTENGSLPHCTGWVGRVELFSGSPALSIPQFHCRSLFMYSCVRTLGLVSSFGSVLLIFSAVQPASHDF
uniref:Uncharacterized protein n=1 Tax=Cyclopterus lumpus TaxID=8103 RepID=A0A8C2ZAE9_CYCLU